MRTPLEGTSISLEAHTILGAVRSVGGAIALQRAGWTLQGKRRLQNPTQAPEKDAELCPV